MSGNGSSERDAQVLQAYKEHIADMAERCKEVLDAQKRKSHLEDEEYDLILGTLKKDGEEREAALLALPLGMRLKARTFDAKEIDKKWKIFKGNRQVVKSSEAIDVLQKCHEACGHKTGQCRKLERIFMESVRSFVMNLQKDVHCVHSMHH